MVRLPGGRPLRPRFPSWRTLLQFGPFALVTLAAMILLARAALDSAWRTQFELDLASALPGPVVNGCELKPYARCPGANLADLRFTGLNLTHAQLAGARLTDMDLRNARLDDADISDAHLDHVDLQRAELRGTRLDGAELSNVTLADANLHLARLDNARLQNVDLTGADLRGALLYCTAIQPDAVLGATRTPNGVIVNSYAEWQASCRGLAFRVVNRELGLTAPCGADNALRVLDKTVGLERDDLPNDLVDLSVFDLPTAPGGSPQQMRFDAAVAFSRLVAGARQAGYSILPISGYRSYAAQESLFDGYVQSELGGRRGDPQALADAIARANRYSAMAGHSEHQLGTVMDVSTAELRGALEDSFASTKAGQWLTAHAHEYGFAFSYLEGKENLTGYVWEPWHLRWVGPIAASALYAQGYIDAASQLTLARYLAGTTAPACESNR